MATRVGTEKNIAEVLKDLLELEYDALEAYKAAVARLESVYYKEQMRSFQADHERHTFTVRNFIEELGATPPKEADFKAVLTKGKVVIGSIVGDKGILMAMLSNEEDTNLAYERISARPDFPGHMRLALDQNLKDEQRHRNWIESALAEQRKTA